MKKLKVLELFSGTECISNAFRNRGDYECFTVDWGEEFPSSLHIDISKLTLQDILDKFGIPDVIWIAMDCTTFSIAGISHHRRKNEETGNLDPISEYAKFCDECDIHVLNLVKELQKLNPNLIYFIENPRGGMRKMTWMQEYPRYTISYCKYMQNEPWETRRMKPTDIWTNHPNPKFKPMCHNGNYDCHPPAPRGTNKYGSQSLGGSVERSKYPKELCEHIVDICDEYFDKIGE